MSFKTPSYVRISSIALALSVLWAATTVTLTARAGQVKELTAEQIVEGTILLAGNGLGRAILSQIRKNGLERGKETRTAADGRSEEVRYELRFVHGDKAEKDKARL